MLTQLDSRTWLIEGSVGSRPLRLPLLRGGPDAYLLIDTGCAHHVAALIIPAMRELGASLEQLRWIVNTHPDTDHVGGNAALKRLVPSAVLACGTLDVELVESNRAMLSQRYDRFRAGHALSYSDDVSQGILQDLGGDQRVDVGLVEGACIRIGDRWLTVLHLPGHSDGHIGLFDRESRTLFAGDAIHGAVYRDRHGNAALCPTYLDVAAYRRTIDKIRALAPSTYVGCHWPVLRGDAVHAFCAESAAFVDRAERLVLERIAAAPSTLVQLCDALGPLLGEWPASTHHELRYAIGGHLVDLLQRGWIVGSADLPCVFSLATEGRA